MDRRIQADFDRLQKDIDERIRKLEERIRDDLVRMETRAARPAGGTK